MKRVSIYYSRKRGQMKIKEMLFMILALAVFFVIALLFYLSVSLSGLRGDVQQSSRDKAIMLVSMLADAPEFNCGKSKCVDMDKLIVIVNHPLYRTFWDVQGLVIEKVDKDNRTIECNIGNYPNCNVFTIKKPLANTIGDSSIVSLCMKDSKNGYLYDKCYIGRITVWSKI